jgi:hypothetical protein
MPNIEPSSKMRCNWATFTGDYSRLWWSPWNRSLLKCSNTQLPPLISQLFVIDNLSFMYMFEQFAKCQNSNSFKHPNREIRNRLLLIWFPARGIRLHHGSAQRRSTIPTNYTNKQRPNKIWCLAKLAGLPNRCLLNPGSCLLCFYFLASQPRYPSLRLPKRFPHWCRCNVYCSPRNIALWQSSTTHRASNNFPCWSGPAYTCVILLIFPM